MPINFIERSAFYQPSAMSKIYTPFNVSTFEGFYPSSAGKPREVAIVQFAVRSVSLAHFATYSLQTPKRERTMTYNYFSLKPRDLKFDMHVVKSLFFFMKSTDYIRYNSFFDFLGV